MKMTNTEVVKSSTTLLVSALLLSGCGGDSGGGTSITPVNASPVVNAGNDQSSFGKHTVVINAQASDSDGDIASIAWIQSESDSLQVQLLNSDSLQPSFDIPDIYTHEELNFTLSVTDDDGSVTNDSVMVTVQPAEHSLSLSYNGLGDTLQVTNSSEETVTGSFASDYQLQSLVLTNKTTGQTYQIDPTEIWQANITLNEGDNVLETVGVSIDGTTVSLETIVTYNNLIDFTSSLAFDKSTVYMDKGTINIVAIVGSSNSLNPTVSLIDESGNTVAAFKDDGQLPDEIDQDGIFTTSFNVSPTEEGEICYRVSVTNPDSGSYMSEKQCLWAVEPLTQEEVATSVEVADAVSSTVNKALDEYKTPEEASLVALQELNANQNIGEAGTTPDGGLWWVTDSGVLGLYHSSIEGSKRGGSGGTVGATPILEAKFAPQYYSTNKLNESSRYIADSVPVGVQAMSAMMTSSDNRVQSSRSVIVSPYINNPKDVGNSFGQNDDYFSVWQTLKTKGSSCQLEASHEAINNGSSLISLDNFKDYSQFGYVHISTHGDNFYQGLLSSWNPVWGPNDFLQGSLSQVALYSGLVLPKNEQGQYDLSGYEDDIQAKRIAIGSEGSIVLLPSFFKHYLTSMPNSLVVLSACRSMHNNSLANVFLGKGAGAIVGYDDYVLTSYAQNTTNGILVEMLETDATFGEAVASAISIYGENDSSMDPAALKIAGSMDLKLPNGMFNNLGFEDGVKGAWVDEGDGRVLTKLGSTLPISGQYVGIISTGLGYTTSSGSFEQNGCLAPATKTLSFNWNFFSEEFREYCGTNFDDAFEFSVCETGTTNCEEFKTSVNLLCEAEQSSQLTLSQSDVSFDRGGVFDTGWKQQTLNIETLAGKAVTIKASATDVGDSIYDTAILLDDIEIN